MRLGFLNGNPAIIITALIAPLLLLCDDKITGQDMNHHQTLILLAFGS